MIIDDIDKKILNNYQRGLSVSDEIYKNVTNNLKINEDELFFRLKNLKTGGYISRIGAVFSPNSIGCSTLAAVSCDKDKLIKTAETLNKFKEVNHNYQREHKFNLWFVITAENKQKLDKIICKIEREIGFYVLSLPMLKEYHIDLGFDINNRENKTNTKTTQKKIQLDIKQKKIVNIIQKGLPICPKPFSSLADNNDIAKDDIVKTIKVLIKENIIRRFGVVVRHHELGYRHNAMWVLDIEDSEVDIIAEKLAKIPEITLCYLRPRKLPYWSYNLFCMIHGKDALKVKKCIENIKSKYNLNKIKTAVLFCQKRFKQKGASYIN
jgi:siroheme decarboxylase